MPVAPIAVREQHAAAVQFHQDRIFEEDCPGLARETLADQEIAVATHEIDWNAALRALRQVLHDAGMETIAQRIVSRPVFEQVTQDVQGIGSMHASEQKTAEQADDVRARRCQMNVGDEQYRQGR